MAGESGRDRGVRLTERQRTATVESCGLLFLVLGIHFVLWGLVAAGAYLLLCRWYPLLRREGRGKAR